MGTKTLSDMYGRLIMIALLILSVDSFSQPQSIAVPDGYAGYEGTTGGGSATPVTVSSASEFISAVNNNNPAVIIVNGMLNVGTVSIGSNKTILGMDENSGLYGGVIQIRGSNYIFQNLTFGPSGSDVLEISGGTKVFITRCSFHDAGDELCSIVREADYVTVSWCKFYFDNPHDHAFGHLIGNSDSRESDRGKLHVTMHHNWYAEGIRGRMPRVRYGHVHIYNNFYNSAGNGYCIGVGYECHIRLENTHFENISGAWADYGGIANGEMGWNNLIFVGCSQPTFVSNSYPVFSPPYPYNMSAVEDVKTMVMEGAGNVFGGIHDNYPDISITSPLDSVIYAAGSSIIIEADASVEEGVIAYVSFYSDTLLGTDSIAPYSFTWENVKQGIYNLYATVTDTNDITGYSSGIMVFVGSGVIVQGPKDGATFNVPADITISAYAWSGTDTVSRVDFYSDTSLLGTDHSLPYSYTWNDVQPGTYNLTARAIENIARISVSEPVSITVIGGPEGYEYCSPEGGSCTWAGLYNIAYGADGKFNYIYNVTGTVDCKNDVFGDPIYGTAKSCWVQEAVTPYVSITAPTDGTEYTAPVNISIEAYAVDNYGTIDSVHFFQNDKLLGVSSVAPFSYTWSDVEAGSYRITAIAIDNDGNSDTSQAVSITVIDATGLQAGDHTDVTLYPNPVSGELVLHLGDRFSDEAECTLYSSLGVMIMNEFLSGSEHRLNLKEIRGGVYFLAITSRQRTIVRRLIKE
jgi:pectate lyase